MKTAEELNALKEEADALKKKLDELTDEELKQVTGGLTREHYKNVLRKADSLYRRELINFAQLLEIQKAAYTLGENDYGWWALRYAETHGLKESDISYW